MASGMFYFSDRKAKALSEFKYEKEEVLQKIIADNPDLIRCNVDQENTRYYLIKQEIAVPESDFALDHLMITSDGLPVLVEVKRSTDTRIRREVVAQMLDYAARASRLELSTLQEAFAEANEGVELSEETWQAVETNLRAEKLRLVFAADDIPASLQVLMEFLNRKMPDLEIYGVEIKQFRTADGTLMLTTNTVESAVKEEIRSEKKAWNLTLMQSFLREHQMAADADVLGPFLSAAEKRNFKVRFGKGSNLPTAYLNFGQYCVAAIDPYEYKEGFRAPIDIKPCSLSPLSRGKWSQEGIIQELKNTKAWANGQNFKKGAWETPQYLYFCLKTMQSDADIAEFLDKLHDIAAALERSEE